MILSATFNRHKVMIFIIFIIRNEFLTTMRAFNFFLFIHVLTHLHNPNVKEGYQHFRLSQYMEIPDNLEICSPCRKQNEHKSMSVFSPKLDKMEGFNWADGLIFGSLIIILPRRRRVRPIEIFDREEQGCECFLNKIFPREPFKMLSNPHLDLKGNNQYPLEAFIMWRETKDK